MKKFKYEFEVNDDFEVGCCMDCPFNHTEWYDNDGWNDCYDYCIIGGNCEDKLEEVKDE